MGINTATLLGRLVAEPDLRKTNSDYSVTNFTVAIDRTRSSDGERKSDFIDCVTFGATADFVAKYFHKGMWIAGVGSIYTDNYTEKDTGKKRKNTKVCMERVTFTSDKKQGEEANAPDRPKPAKAASTKEIEGGYKPISVSDDDDDDVPF